MKTIKINISAITLLLILCSFNLMAQKKTNTEVIKIKTSAVCDMCKQTLEKAMAYEKGVKNSSLDVASKILTVEYKLAKTNPEKIKKAVIFTGYDADELVADPKAYENLHPCCKKDFVH
jgi:periplasmic mercuric ion binding protein